MLSSLVTRATTTYMRNNYRYAQQPQSQALPRVMFPAPTGVVQLVAICAVHPQPLYGTGKYSKAKLRTVSV